MIAVKKVALIITEYGVPWAINRGLYSLKLRLLRAIPHTEVLFEPKNVDAKRINIFNIDNASITTLLKELPIEEKEKLIKSADNAIRGKICGFSSIELDYGYPINWQLNPLTQKVCDSKLKWYQIPDFDSERGDIKAIWEASRFSHFFSFARAFLLTNDKKYYDAFHEQLSDWLKKNPYSYGANFKCGQECSLRMISALMVFTIFDNAGLTDVDDKENLKLLVNNSYRKIQSNFFYAYRCIKNNHTISELVGIIIGAWCCEDVKTISKAYRLLDKVILEQFTEDGGYTQFSFNYQRLALQDINLVLSLEKFVHLRLSDEAYKRIEKSALLLYQVIDDKSGDVPNYGSNDGALIFPVTSCGYRDFRAVINTTLALVSGYRVFGSGLWDEEFLWFGRKAPDFPIRAIYRSSFQFPKAGLYSIRDASKHIMIVLNDYKSRPAHMDQMHIDLWLSGVNIICDSGTYSYVGELGAELASTLGHNTVKVVSLEQMNKAGAFMVYDWSKRRNISFSNYRFEGEMISANRYKHRRTVELKDEIIEITDEVDSSYRDWQVVFHTPCKVFESKDGISLMDGNRELCSISGADCTIQCTRISTHYLRSEPCARIEFKSNGNSKTKITINLSKI